MTYPAFGVPMSIHVHGNILLWALQIKTDNARNYQSKKLNNLMEAVL